MEVKSMSRIRTVQQVEKQSLESSGEQYAQRYHDRKGYQALTDALLPAGKKAVCQVNDSIVEKPEVKGKGSTNEYVNGKGQTKCTDYPRVIKDKFKQKKEDDAQRMHPLLPDPFHVL
jgi:hypothetical protein